MHTCQHIFCHCIQDMMLASGGTVVLATHQTELFPHATSLAVMAGGRIAYSGGSVSRFVMICAIAFLLFESMRD